MKCVRFIFLLCLCLILKPAPLFAQCPTNLDFESGNFTNWRLYTGTCCPISTPTLGAAATRHTITSGSGTDAYGGFPVVAPSSGIYSMKLGNDDVGAEAERARYFVHVPSGVNNYSVIFRYAIVLQDPTHVAGDQPRFEVKAFDSVTGATVNCSDYSFIASASLPGFTVSAIASNVYYKSWSTASIDLSGSAGRTVALQFSSGDCRQGQHFGYGYVDLSCSLFQINYNACDTASTVVLSAPPGFSSYSWRDSATMTSIGTGQTITITRPAVTTTYAVILTPYTGFGCADTLYTKVTVNNLSVNATNDTSICKSTAVQLNAGATASATPLTYSWTPTTNLSCSTCANPIATISSNANYKVTVTDRYGCSKSDSLRIRYSNITTTLTPTATSCFGDSSGSIATTVTAGRAPYTYSWNTTPAKTTSNINNLKAGTYIITVSDSIGCSKKDTTIILQPTPVVASIDTIINVSCYNGNNSLIVSEAAGGTGPYTYSWNTSPVQQNDSAIAVRAGNYIVTIKDSKNCSDTASAIVTQPTVLNAAVPVKSNASCNSNNNGWAKAMVTGGIAPYTYSWNTTPAQTTDTAKNLAAGTYIVTVTDQNGCTDTGIVIVTQPTAVAANISSFTNVSCYNGNNGQATVSVSGGTPTYTYSWNTTPVQSGNTATSLQAGNYIVSVTDNNGCTDTAGITITQPAVLSAVIDSTANVKCYNGNNGFARVIVTGGTTNYTYSWNTTPAKTTAIATSLAAGNYAVIVTDNKGCKDTATTIITQPAQLIATATTSAISCNSIATTATVTATGGTNPYSYSWNTSPAQTTATATGLATGTYIATVTDTNGCTDTAIANIALPTTLNATIAARNNVNCYNGNNGWAKAAITGGTAPYSYSWNTTPAQTTDTARNLAAGTYIVTITDANGCDDTAIVTITQPAQLDAIIDSTANVSCYNGNNGLARVAVTGGTTGYTYSWNTSPVKTTATASGLIAGNYAVIVTDSKGCRDTAATAITQPAILVATATTSAISCNTTSTTATVTATGGTNPYSYSWNTTPVQTTATITSLATGSYIATVTDSNGCTDTAIANITLPTTLNASIPARNNVNCYNGNNGWAKAAITGGTAPYTYSWSTTPAQTTDTARNLAAGTYTVTITDANGCDDTAIVSITQPAQLDAIIDSTVDVSCYTGTNGFARVAITGGTTGYTYSWNTTPVKTTATASSLGAGSYAVIVTDSKGCKDTATAIIAQPAALSAATTSTPIGCFGGSTSSTAVATGGTSPYTYSWNTTPVQTTATATALVANSYIVTITDSKGCTDTAQANITQPLLLNAGIAAKRDANCSSGGNGWVAATANGGSGNYSYSWNTTPIQTTDTARNLAAGIYTVTVTDGNGCTDTAMVTITQPSTIVANIAAVTNVSCNAGNNGAATVTVAGGTSPYTYSWNTTPAQTTISATTLAAGTYIVTVTDNNGCTDTAMATIIQPLALNAGITSVTNSGCSPANTGSATVAAIGGTSPYTYRWNSIPVQTTSTATALPAGLYTATVTDSKGCTDTAMAGISQPTTLVASVNTYNNITCHGSNNGAATVTVSGGTTPYTYSWNTSPVRTTATITGLTGRAYTATVTDALGCTDTAIVTITEPQVLNASISSSTNLNCYGAANGAAAVSVNGGITPYTYSWNTTPVQTTAAASSLPAGSYIVTVTDNNGCTDTARTIITQPAAMNAAITSSTNNNCNGSKTGTAIAVVTGGTPLYTYSWNTTPVQLTATATGLGAGIYTMTATDSKGCTDTAVVTITQPSILNAYIAGTTNVSCNNGANASATTGVTGGTAPYTYRWSTSPIQTAATALGLPTGTYVVLVTDNKGCTDTAVASLSQPAALVANISSFTNVDCFAARTGSASVAVTGGTSGYSYAWNTTPVQNTPTAGSLPSGNYAVVVTDSKGCRDTANISISQPTKLNASITSTGNVKCYNGNDGAATLLATGGTTPYSYSWNTTPVQTSTIAAALPAGTYIATVTDNNGCIDTATAVITQPAAFTVIASGIKNACVETADGTAEVTSVTGGIPPYTYLWNTATPQSGKTARSLTSGNYTVTVTDAMGCTATGTAVVDNYPKIALVLTPDTFLCEGQGVALAASGGDSYKWQPPAGLSCTTCSNPVATPNANTTYTVTVTDSNNCIANGKVSVNVIIKNATNVGPDQNICEGATTKLQANGGTEYTWWPSEALDDSRSAAPTTNTKTTTKYYVAIKQNECFTDTLSQTVHISPMPTVDVGPDMDGTIGTQVQLQAKMTNASQILWSPPVLLSCIDCPNPLATLEKTITYKATVQNELGCIAEDELTITVKCDESLLFIPNTFTPNGDRVNDRFYPSSKGVKHIKAMKIYNRWGQVLYEAYDFPANNPDYGWDGSFKGSTLTPDVFVYIIETTCTQGQNVFLKGDISIVK